MRMAVYCIQCTVDSGQGTVYSLQSTVYSLQCIVYNVQCTVYSVQCTLFSLQCTGNTRWLFSSSLVEEQLASRDFSLDTCIPQMFK